MCFSKGLGAPVGSVVVGEGGFVSRARRLRKMMGGGLRQAGVVTGAARVAVEETFLGGRLAGTHERARVVGGMWEERGGRVVGGVGGGVKGGVEGGGGVKGGVETNMVWLDLEAAGITKEKFVEAGVREGVKLLGGRVVVHYQICDEAVERLGRVMDAVLLAGRSDGNGNGNGDGVRDVDGDGVGVREEAGVVMEAEME